MVDVRIDIAANTKQAISEVQRLRAAQAQLNAELERTGIAAAGAVNPKGYDRMQAAMRASSATWRSAAASTGQFHTEQLRLNSATDQFTKALQKQKVSFGQMLKQRKIVLESYREQVRLQNMFVRESPSMGRGGKGLYDVAIPRTLSAELNTAGERLRWFNALVASGSTQMINWGKNTQWAGRQLMVGFTIPTAAFGAATGALAFQVDKQLTRIMKVYDTATVAVKGDSSSMAAAQKELAEVTEAAWGTARMAAQQYGAAAVETLKVQADLAATGLKGAELQSSTNEVMRIATLGEIDYQEATKATIALQSAFRLSTTELAEAFNFMNATENATSLAIADIIEATPRAASAMSALGVNVQQMTVMLTSMRESGVDAAEAANALKSATGSILAPSPAADQFIQQITQGRVQVTKLAEESGGNLYFALQGLFEQMQGLSQLQKQQILVKLFGKYQFNRVSAMLYNMGDAFEGTSNQTAKAIALMSKSSTELANTADVELSRIQESLAGRFKQALETVKTDLAQMGEPFLKAGITILGVIGEIVEMFNKLPDGLKNAAAWVAIVAALVGPLVMLTGLTANFLGTGIKFSNWLLALGRDMGIVTKESKAMELASLAAKNGWDTQTAAVMSLREQIELLILAEREAAYASRGITGVNGVMHGPSLPTTQAGWQQYYLNQQTKYKGKADGSLGAPRYVNSLTGMYTSKQIADAQAAQRATEKMRDVQQDITHLANDESKARGRTQNYLAGSGAMLGVMAVSAAAMAFSGNEFVDDLLMLTMIGSVAVPAMKMLVGLMAVGATRAKETYALVRATAMTQEAGAVAGAAQAASAGRFKTGIKAAGAGMMAMMGPVGWVTAAVAAIGGGIWLWKKHQEAVWEDTVAWHADLNSAVGSWAASLNKVATEYDRIALAESKIAGNPQGFTATVAAYDTGDKKEVGDAFQKLSERDQQLYAMQLYVDLMQKLGMTSQDAKDNVMALFVATGTSAQTASQYITDIQERVGDLADPKNKQGWFDVISNASTMVSTNLEDFLKNNDNDEIVKTNALHLVEVFSEGFANAGPATARVFLDEFIATAQSEYERALSEIGSSVEGRAFLSDMNIADATGLREWFDSADSPIDDLKNYFGDTIGPELENQLMSAQALEKIVVKTFAHYNGLGDDIDRIVELQREWNVLAGTMKYADQVVEAKKLAELANSALQATNVLGQEIADVTAQNALAAINAFNLSQGYRQGETYVQALAFLVNRVTDNTEDAASAADMLASKLAGIPRNLQSAFDFNRADKKNLLQNAMSGLVSDMASQASDNFQDQMNADLDAMQESWDNRIEAQQDRDDAQMERFEARWEKKKDALEALYDSRIEKIQATIDAEQKAEEQRQKMFQAEMTRLDRLANMAESNIDFNVALNAGDFDEAAKIQNNIAAQWTDWMLQDAADASADATKDRTEKLEDRIEALEENRDAEMEDLEKREDAERKHLEKVQEMRMDALRDQAEAAQDARRAAWELDKKSFDDRLDLFKSFTGRNMKDLKAWMELTGFAYEDFGDVRLKPMGQDWAQYFRNQLFKQIRLAGSDIANDKMWENMAGKEAAQILRGFGFNNIEELAKFIRTGKLPKNPPTESTGSNLGTDHQAQAPVTRHAGGWVMGGKNSRAGVARTQRGLGPGETYGLLRNNEFVVNERSAVANKALLENINNSAGPLPRGVMGGLGVGSIALGAAGSMFLAGMGAALKRAYKGAKRGMTSGISGSTYIAGPGGYHRPISGGYPGSLHDTSTGFPAVDIAIPKGTTLYAVGDGRVRDSYDIRGYEPRRMVHGVTGPSVQDGYRSYGRVITQDLGNGDTVLYAHLSSRAVGKGQTIKGGSVIGKTGNTGYVRSTSGDGSHLHFGASSGRPLAYLKNGGTTRGEGLAYLHDQETVMSKPLSKKFEEGVIKWNNVMPKGGGDLAMALWNNFDPRMPGSQMLLQRIGKIVSDNTQAGNGGQVKTGTYNLFRKSKNANSKNDLTRLMKLADILSLTEFIGAKRGLSGWIKQMGWGLYSPAQNANDTALMWNKAKYEMSNPGMATLPGTGSGAFRTRGAVYGNFKSKFGGPDFWQIAAHTAGYAQRGNAGWLQTMRMQYAALAKLVARLSGTGKPVFLAGDFNNKPNMSGHEFPFKGLFDTSKGMGLLDRIFASMGVKLTDSAIIRGLSSDHSALLNTFQVPQMKVGGWAMSDGLAMIHEGEPVLTKPLGAQLTRGIDNFANGGGTTYNLNVYAQPGMSEQALIRATFREAERREARKPRKRKEN